MELKRNQLALPTSLEFILAGNCTLTFKSLTSGKHFTYKVKASKDNSVHFVQALNGVEERYVYIGYIRNNQFVYGRKSAVKEDTNTVLAFKTMFAFSLNRMNTNKGELYHSGKCGRCGRKLTHPESLTTGIGPECGRRMK